jgi:hypothetical protein
MRVRVDSLDDFLDNLRESRVVQGVVWVSRTENPLDGENRREAVRFRVDLQASAVCEFGEGEYLLEYGEYCGIDYRDASQEMEGTDRAAMLRVRLVEHCREHGLALRPGVIDM